MAATATDYDETVKDIEESIGQVPGFMSALPENALVNEWPTFKRYILGESEIPPKYRELMGLAAAANIKCPYCQAFHRGAAELHGATEAELSETAVIASMTARWSTMLHAQNYDQEAFLTELAEMSEFLRDQQATD